jgi:hypothetical protein
MKRIGLVVIVSFALFTVLGCLQRQRIADLTIMSSKNISTLEGAKEMGIFEGRDCRIAMANQLPNQEEALDKALEAGGGNAMVNAVIYYKPANCMFDDICWEVKGTVIKTKDMLSGSVIRGKDNKIFDNQNYVREVIGTPGGPKYWAFKKTSRIELDHDKMHYDLIIRIQ